MPKNHGNRVVGDLERPKVLLGFSVEGFFETGGTLGPVRLVRKCRYMEKRDPRAIVSVVDNRGDEQGMFPQDRVFLGPAPSLHGHLHG